MKHPVSFNVTLKLCAYTIGICEGKAMKRKQVCAGLSLVLLIFAVNGCKKNTDVNQTEEILKSVEQTNDLKSVSDNQTLDIWDVMSRITEEYGLENAVNYENEIYDMSKDAIVLLCQSESGKYTAYGFISPEYGKKGILIDNIIDGESNWNYFDKYTWSYDTVKPALQEQGEYDVIFSFTQENDMERELYFETFDTGTMSVKE